MEAPWNLGEFYGSSYFVSPKGKIVAQASEDKDELLTADLDFDRSEEHTSELQSHSDLVCRLLLEQKHVDKTNKNSEQAT